MLTLDELVEMSQPEREAIPTVEWRKMLSDLEGDRDAEMRLFRYLSRVPAALQDEYLLSILKGLEDPEVDFFMCMLGPDEMRQEMIDRLIHEHPSVAEVLLAKLLRLYDQWRAYTRGGSVD